MEIHPSIKKLAKPVDVLLPLEGNPRRGDIGAIAASYREFGQVKPIVVKDNEDGTVWCIEGNTSSKKSGSQRNGGEVCKQLRAYKKNKAGVLISIVGFGRPKFGASATPAKKASASKDTSQKIPAKIDPKVKEAIDLLTKKGYKVSK